MPYNTAHSWSQSTASCQWHSQLHQCAVCVVYMSRTCIFFLSVSSEVEPQNWRTLKEWSTLFCSTGQTSSTLHSPTCPSGVRADCTDSLGLRADSAQTVWTPYDFGSPHKNYTMRELNQAPGTNSHLQGGVLYHCAIVACYTLPTCAIYVTCGLIGKCFYFYSI